MIQIQIKPADLDDCQDIFDWRNDELTRKMSRNSEPVEWGAHCEWYANAINKSNRAILICLDKASGDKLGMVRFDFDLQGDGKGTSVVQAAEISININPVKRGQGLAKPCLLAGLEHVKNGHPQLREILAYVSEHNPASRKSFEGVGFTWKESANGLDCLVLTL